MKLVVTALLAVLIPATGHATCEDGGCRTYTRDPAVRREFVLTHAAPAEPFVVDHIRPRCAGGADTIANMAYEPLDESLLKDELERSLCRRLRSAERRADGTAMQRAFVRYWGDVLALSLVPEIRARARNELDCAASPACVGGRPGS